MCEGFEPAGLIVKASEIIIHKADEPNPIVGLFDSDGLAGEDLAEVDFLPVEADSAAGSDGDGLVMEGQSMSGRPGYGRGEDRGYSRR
jgi:hypothetical protein